MKNLSHPGSSDEWWRSAVIYQVYPRSFADSDGDGIGDLPGIIPYLPYLARLGVDAIWLSPFYVSPQNDGGYDVVDYRNVDPVFGTLSDADALIAAAHGLGLRVIVDLVPNHTSSEHPWFKAALNSSIGSPERNRYLFRNGKPARGFETPSGDGSSTDGNGFDTLSKVGSSTNGNQSRHSAASTGGAQSAESTIAPQAKTVQTPSVEEPQRGVSKPRDSRNLPLKVPSTVILHAVAESQKVKPQGISAEPPNNWRSIFGSEAWTQITESNGQPGQWYLHLFDRTQPDLNWENPEVRAEFDDILRFWLARGVDGFRVDVAHGLIKAPGLPDYDDKVKMADGSPNPAPMFDQDGVHEIYRRWRKVLDEFEVPSSVKPIPSVEDVAIAAGSKPRDTQPTPERRERMLAAEAWVWPEDRLARYIRPDEMQQAFNFEFLTAKWDAAQYRDIIERSLTAAGKVGAPTTWVLSNHDVVRHASRLGLKIPGSKPNGIRATDEQPDAELGLRRAKAATLFMLALPGSAYLYQGEELGLPEHTSLPDEVRQAPEFFRTEGKEAGRDGCRVPLPWVPDAAAFGFSPSGQSWLPQPEDWAKFAVETQEVDPTSTLNFYRAAIALRKKHHLGQGHLTWANNYPKQVLAFRNKDILVLANFGNKTITLPIRSQIIINSEKISGGKLPPILQLG